MATAMAMAMAPRRFSSSSSPETFTSPICLRKQRQRQTSTPHGDARVTDSNNFVQENGHTNHRGVQRNDAHAVVDDQAQMMSSSSSTSVNTQIFCSFCGDDRKNIRCSRCKVTRYCSEKCQIKHWRTGHRIECKPIDVDSVSGVSSKGIGTSHTDISSSDHHRNQDQMPSTSASPYVCLVCGDDKADISCARCKVARYCSGKCQIKHWRAGHRIECKSTDVDSVSGVSNEGIGTSHTDISSSDHHRNQDQMPSTSASPYVCLVCGDDKADFSCARCKVARYCSGKCQVKHWRAGHRIECKPTNVDSVSGVSSEGIGTSHTDISSSDHHINQDQMPSTSASPYVCLVCGDDKADISCARCKVARYCSGKCQVKHWRAGHRIECKPTDVDSVSGVSSEGIGTSHTDISSSVQHINQDQMPSTSASPYVCLVCGDDKADISCARCKVARYCSATCQVKHWRAVHRLECKEYNSPTNLNIASVVTRETRGASPMSKSSFDPHEDRDQMPTSSASPQVCFVCGDWENVRCSRCKAVRYCSQKCQIKHWRAGHKSECKEYKSLSHADASAASSESRGSDDVDISSSDHHRDRDQMPSAPVSRDFCFVCGDWSDIRCNRCKVVRYCSQACETIHWREGHKLECKEIKSPANAYSAFAVSERRGPGHVGTSSSEYQQSKKDGKLANTVQSPKRTSSKELPSPEECPICFSTIHTSEPSSPFLACEICKHKFHATCLLKWFSTSKKSHCPLCQSPFKSEGTAV